MGNKIIIHGTINRPCERCKQTKDCNSFQEGDKNRLMCDECMSEVYGTTKKTQEAKITPNTDLCKTCQALTMVINHDRTTVEKNYIIQIFECEKCGATTKKKVLKWKR